MPQALRLTDLQVRNLKPRPARFIRWEKGGRGLGLRVSPGGVKTWIYVYRLDGTVRWMTLGRYPRMTVKDAHAAHNVALGKVLEGIDPAVEKAIRREKDRSAPTVADLVEDYLEKYARVQKRSWKQDKTILEREIVGTNQDPGPWRAIKAKAIQRRDVVELLNAIVERGCPIKANRTLAVTRRMFGWAVEQDILEHSPCEHVRRPSTENHRERCLTEAEVRIFWEKVRSADHQDRPRLALAVILATAQRT
jgi:integrase